MKNSDSRIDRIYSYFNAIRGNNTPQQQQTTLAVLKKTLELQKVAVDKNLKPYKLNDEELYELMQKVSMEFFAGKLFEDKKQFLDVYKTIGNLEDVTWTDIMECVDYRARFRVPEALIAEMEKNFTKKVQDVLIPEAEKFSPCLERIIEAHKDTHFTLTTMDAFYFKILTEMFGSNEKVDIKQTSIYEYEFTSEKFDLIMAVPVFGARQKIDEPNTFICRDYDMIAAENLALHLKSEGILSIVLPAKITFGGGKVKDLREFLQSMYCLKELNELPAGIFEYTGIKTFLLKITTGRTDEVTVKKYAADTENTRKREIGKLIVQDETFVLEDELTDMGDWNVERIFQSQDADWINFKESSVKKQELGTVATIFRGKAVSRKDPTGNIGVVNISNIGEYEVDYTNLDYLEEEERKVEKYILEDGDLLIPARGTVIRVAIFEKQSYPCIASSNVVVIRASDESLSTTYLKLFLDSPLGRKMLITRQQGTSVMNISYKELNNIEIPLPSIEEQKQIAETYTKELEVYKKAIQEAENRWSSVLSDLQGRI